MIAALRHALRSLRRSPAFTFTVIAKLGIGIALSLSLTCVPASVIGKLRIFDVIAYAIASLAVLTIALLATLLPAQAAANVDPMTVLRSE